MRPMCSLLLGCLWLSLIVACGTAPETSSPSASANNVAPGTSLTVFAAASLTEAFGAIGRQFEQQHGVNVAFNFAGSQQLSQQLAQGAEADVFASANRQEIE